MSAAARDQFLVFTPERAVYADAEVLKRLSYYLMEHLPEMRFVLAYEMQRPVQADPTAFLVFPVVDDVERDGEMVSFTANMRDPAPESGKILAVLNAFQPEPTRH